MTTRKTWRDAPDPCKKGDKFQFKGWPSPVYIHICHKPGNGFGVSYSRFTPEEVSRLDVYDLRHRLEYLPWHEFKRRCVSAEATP